MEEPQLYVDIADDEERCTLLTLHLISEYLADEELTQAVSHGITEHSNPACIDLAKNILKFLLAASTIESEVLKKHSSDEKKQFAPEQYVEQLRMIEKYEVTNAVAEAKQHRLN